MSTFPTDAEREALVLAIAGEDCLCGHEACETLENFVLRTLAPHIATREAAAAAKALREAADRIDLSGHYDPYNPTSISRPGAECRNAEGAAESWLRERAKVIERGESS